MKRKVNKIYSYEPEKKKLKEEVTFENVESHICVQEEVKKESVLFYYPSNLKVAQLANFAKEVEKMKKGIAGFSSVNTEEDVKEVFGKKIEDMTKWKIPFPDPEDLEYLKESASNLQKNYQRKLDHWVGKKEQDDRVYITDVVDEAVVFAKTKREGNWVVLNEEKVKGKEAAGPVDYVVKFNGVVLVILEAKKSTKFDEEGIPQLLMQLKAVQEEEGMKNKWYYGFTATKELWTPCRLNMKLKKDEVQIGQRMTLNSLSLDTFVRLLFVITEILQGKIK